MLGQRIGNYLIVGQIGQGGMGSVYEAVHEKLNLRVAVKVLSKDLVGDEDLLQRFSNEARALSVLAHPGIVKLIDFGRLPDGTVYLLLERLKGETMQQRLQRMVGRLPLSEALRLASELAGILTAVHRRGLVHRDIKPSNIFLAQSEESPGEEQVKLLDFGLVKLLSGSGLLESGSRTRSDLLVGTPEYMPPEQCQGLEIGPKADVYALGVMLFRLVCGELPFVSDNPIEIFTAQVKQAPPSLRLKEPSVPVALDGLVEAMLCKDPRLRPSMAQVAARLQAIDDADCADETLIATTSRVAGGRASQGYRRRPASGGLHPRAARSGQRGGAQGVSQGELPGEYDSVEEEDMEIHISATESARVSSTGGGTAPAPGWRGALRWAALVGLAAVLSLLAGVLLWNHSQRAPRSVRDQRVVLAQHRRGADVLQVQQRRGVQVTQVQQRRGVQVMQVQQGRGLEVAQVQQGCGPGGLQVTDVQQGEGLEVAQVQQR